jgi:hypothetical protein
MAARRRNSSRPHGFQDLSSGTVLRGFKKTEKYNRRTLSRTMHVSWSCVNLKRLPLGIKDMLRWYDTVEVENVSSIGR